MIELTVALPMFRNKTIAHVALESLCRQKDIDFDWELLIMEEEQDCVGEEELKKYVPRLEAIRCKRIKYWNIKDWIPLSEKWRKLGLASSPTSESFLIQAGDCYSQPYRLKETYDLYASDPNIDWVQAPTGYFYDVSSETVALFSKDFYKDIKWSKSARNHPCALNMSMRRKYASQLAEANVKSSVDMWLFNQCKEMKGEALVVGSIESDNWKLGVDVHGLNKISVKRGSRILGSVPPFRQSDANIDDIVPEDIAEFLRDIKQHVKRNQTIFNVPGNEPARGKKKKSRKRRR